MQAPVTGGPSGTAEWTEHQVGDGASHPTTILVLPDATAGQQDGIHYVLPKVPSVARDAAGEPIFSLTLVLSRQPQVDDDALEDLIEQGRLALTFSLSVPSDALAGLPASPGLRYQPLFARDIQLSLEASDGDVRRLLATVVGSGSDARLALDVGLDRRDALALLAALDGTQTHLQVRADVIYRTAGTSRRVRLSGSAVEIYDDLERHVNRGGFLYRDDVRERLEQMLSTGIIVVSDATVEAAAVRVGAVDGELLFRAFMRVSSLLLYRDTPELPLDDPQNRYIPRQRPHPMMQLDLTETVTSAGERTVALLAPLEEIIGGLLDGREWSRFVHLVGPSDGVGSGYRPIARRVRTMRGTTRAGPQRLPMAVAGGKITSLALALTPDTMSAPTAHALLASDAVHAIQGPHTLAHDLVIDRIDVIWPEKLKHLPIVDNPAGALWPDRMTAGRFWYAPSFEVIQPAPTDDPAASPFLFSYRRVGVTAGPNPMPGLEGTLRITLRQAMSQATKEALAARNNPPAEPVPLGGLSVALDVPFREEGTGRTRMQRFATEVQEQGNTIVVTVALLDSWVRLCYGALAYPDFQTQPAQLSLAYAFRAYVPLDQNDHLLAYGGKIALTAVAVSAFDLPQKIDRPVFSQAETRFYLPNGELQLSREAAAVRSEPARATLRPATAAAAMAVVAATPVTHSAVVASPAFHHAAVIARPELEVAAGLNSVIVQTRYAMQSIVHEERPQALFPCSTVGGLYVESSAEGDRVVGCQDAFRLGEVEPRQYEEITDLRHERYRVLRSLQQPGRFLVLPATYRISRLGPSEPEGRAYRSLVMIYAVLNPNPANNRYYLRATLQPDIPYYLRRDLEQQIAPYTPFGHVAHFDYPTDPIVQAETAYQWSVPSEFGQPEAEQMWDGFQVSLSATQNNALLLLTLLEMDGVTGRATFTLPDGTSLSSQLVMDSAVCGPWNGGPVGVSIAGGSATLTNHIEQSVNVFELVTRPPSGSAQRTSVDTALEPGASTQVAVAGDVAEAYVVYDATPQRIALRQLNIFVEDIDTNVFFVNLVNYANHNLRQLHIQARLKDTDYTYDVPIDESATAIVQMTLPLTTYLERHVVQFQVSKTFADVAQPSITPWIDWDLDTQGVSIGLTWELIQ